MSTAYQQFHISIEQKNLGNNHDSYVCGSGWNRKILRKKYKKEIQLNIMILGKSCVVASEYYFAVQIIIVTSRLEK